jgi:hypothetical protein
LFVGGEKGGRKGSDRERAETGLQEGTTIHHWNRPF